MAGRDKAGAVIAYIASLTLNPLETFKNEFGGVIFHPKLDRESGRARGAWHRTDEYKRILESGPLAVPETLRN